MAIRVGDRVRINNPIYDSNGEVGTVSNYLEYGYNTVLIVKLDNGEVEKVAEHSVEKIKTPVRNVEVEEKIEIDFGIPNYLKRLTPEKFDELIESMVLMRCILFGEPEFDECDDD